LRFVGRVGTREHERRSTPPLLRKGQGDRPDQQEKSSRSEKAGDDRADRSRSVRDLGPTRDDAAEKETDDR